LAEPHLVWTVTVGSFSIDTNGKLVFEVAINVFHDLPIVATVTRRWIAVSSTEILPADTDF
jgi:hypothetical protein